MKKILSFFAAFFIVLSSIFAQLTPVNSSENQSVSIAANTEPCGFDHFHQQLLNNNPDYKKRTDDFNAFMKTFTPQKSGNVYKVPVVVHVMHKGEPVGTGSNISEEDINQGILQLNERFRKIPGSLGDGNGVDLEIEFALAVRDPNGNCTNGIVRVDMTGNSTYMNSGVRAQTSNGISDASLKATSRWNTLEYYNIYLVSEIDNNECGFGVQGYAYFASAHGQSYDGMVQLGCKFAQSGNTTLTHELGHAMNLYHTFEGDNNGNSCPSNNNCNNEGDRCCDIPPHIRSASNCVTGTNSCDGGSSKELFIHNYMDYSSDACQNMFTSDQKARAIAALTVQRASYLASNGNMALVPPSTAGVDFSVSANVVCLGTPVTFYDESTCIPNTYQNGGWPNVSFLWTFDDGVNPPITSTDQNPTVNFTQIGAYDVTLEVTNGSGTTNLTKPGFVSVANGVQSSTCQNTSSNNGNFGYAISKVVFNTINNTSSSSTNGAWQDLTCTKNTQVTQGQNYNLEVTVNSGNSGAGLQFRVYIDYNNDGAYTAGEMVMSNSIVDNTSQTFTTSVNIPLTSTTGQLLRLRAISDGGTLGSGCESPLLVGDVEDYGVYINPVGAPPVADFSATPTTLCEGNTVSFTDLSTNTPTSWSWSFPGGTPSSSTTQTPTVTYNTAGTYQVQLTATNAFGNDVETKVGYITVNGVPSNAGAITGSVSECENATGVSYSIASVSGATNYTWTVPTGATIASGQGTTGITVNFGTSSGNVTVTPSNNCGNGGVSSTSVSVNSCGSAPVADFSATPTTLCEGNTISFTDLSTNTPTSWSWSFPGGTPTSSSAQHPTITYNTAGTYQVQLTATNAFGNDVETKVGYITVNGVPSNAGAITGSVSECENATGVSYSIASVSGATNYTWTVPTGAAIASGQGTTGITVNFGTSSGNVTVTPSNNCGNGGVSSTSVSVNSCGSAPVADFSATPTTLCEGNTVSFTDLSTNTPTSWSWSFPGGTPTSSSSQHPTITYNTAGTYQVQLTATNAFGNDVETKVGYITVNALPSITISSTNETCLKNDGTATASGGGSYLWNDSNAQTTSTATGLSAGIYTVTVTLNGCSSQQNVTVNADNCIPNTEIKPQFCGIVLGDITDEISAYKVPGASAYEYRLIEQGIGTVLTYTYSLYKLKLAWISGIKYNTTYSIGVRAKIGNDWGAFSNVCNVTTPIMPTPDVISNVCGNVIGSLSELIYVKSVNKASNYEYRLTEKGTSNIYYTNNTIWRVTLSWFGSAIKYNTVYELQTRAYVNGDWGNFSPICEITTPDIPLSNVTSGQCGTTISSLSELIYFSPVLKASNYEYRLTEKGTSNIYYTNNTIWRVTLSWFGVTLQQNTVYELEARAYVNGDWGNFGTICEITTPVSSARYGIENEEIFTTDNNQLNNNTNLTIYPNPSQGEFIYFELKTSDKNADVLVSDLTGKIVHQQNLLPDDYSSSIRFNEKLKPGFYLVTVLSGNQKVTKKLVVK